MPTPKNLNLYAVLGVEPTATQEEITAAYRKLAMKLHPDRMVRDEDNWQECDANAEEFVEVGNAYAILSDVDLRADYDKFGFDNGGLMVNDRAKKELVVLVVAAIDNASDVEHFSPLDDVRAAILKTQAQLRQQMRTNERLNDKRRKARDRIRPAQEDNPVIVALDALIRQMVVELEAMEKHVGLSDRMLLLLDDYGYDVMGWMSQSTGSTTTTAYLGSHPVFLLSHGPPV